MCYLVVTFILCKIVGLPNPAKQFFLQVSL